MPVYDSAPYHQPIRERIITQTDKKNGSRLPVGTKIVEYRKSIVYLYPSGKSFTKMKSLDEMRMY